MKTLIAIIALALAAGLAFAGEIIETDPVDIGIRMTGFVVQQSRFESSTGNWIISAACRFHVPEIVLTEEQTAQGENVRTRVNRVITIVVTPDELATAAGVPVEDLGAITNDQLQAAVRASALSQAITIISQTDQ